MNPNILPLVEAYRAKGVLIDTNLLLVLLVGNVDPGHVGKIARTNGYRMEHYEVLREFVNLFSKLLTLPHVLTEAGNLLDRNCGGFLFELQQQLAGFISVATEIRLLSKRIPPHVAFHELGYSDTAIMHAAAGRCLLITDDGPLKGRAASCGVDVLPFDWLQR